MVQHYYRNVHAVVFVYDMTKIGSFENMPAWIEECDRHNLNKVILNNEPGLKRVWYP
jgi:Ras-related protein Rab-33B